MCDIQDCASWDIVYKLTMMFKNYSNDSQFVKMKIFCLLIPAVLCRKSETGHNQDLIKVDMRKRPMLKRMMQESIGLYNWDNQHKKRVITFDPTTLGCKWSSKQALTCKHAKVFNTVSGRVIYPQKTQ